MNRRRFFKGIFGAGVAVAVLPFSGLLDFSRKWIPFRFGTEVPYILLPAPNMTATEVLERRNEYMRACARALARKMDEEMVAQFTKR